MDRKEHRRFAFRSHVAEIEELTKAADRNNVSLSAFIRNAAHAAKAGLTDNELNGHLLAVRSMLNASLNVRTEEQKQKRVIDARDYLTALIHRKGPIDGC